MHPGRKQLKVLLLWLAYWDVAVPDIHACVASVIQIAFENEPLRIQDPNYLKGR